MHSYAISEPTRKFVYIGTVALSAAASIAARSATADHRGVVAGAAFAVAYVITYSLYEFLPLGRIPMRALSRERLKDGHPKASGIAAFREMMGLTQP